MGSRSYGAAQKDFRAATAGGGIRWDGRSRKSAEEAARAAAEAALSRLPPSLQRLVRWLLSRWPGRIAIQSMAACIRIEVFDRSMTVAAQFFTSVFPILILMATWVGGSDTNKIADTVDLPKESRSVLEQAVEGSDNTTFSIVGVLIVLVSATSLSRALTRAFATIWELPRPKSRLTSAWRWLAVVIVLAISLVLVRTLSAYVDEVPPRNLWHFIVSLICDLTVATFVPWILLSGRVQIPRLVPGALLFALTMLAVRPASAIWLPRALEESADRYGTIGVAFSYLAWLYVVAFCFLVTSVIGQVIATDRGRLGIWIRQRALVDSAAQPDAT